MSRGRPFPPGNKFGRGRPKGSKNKRTQAAESYWRNIARPFSASQSLTHQSPQYLGTEALLGTDHTW